MRKNSLLLLTAAATATLYTAGPAWGQRIRLAESALAEDAASPTEEKIAAQPPLKRAPEKPSASPPSGVLPAPETPAERDPRPAAPPPEADQPSGAASSTPVAQRVFPGEVIETPPPYFLPPDQAAPLYDDYPLYGEPYAPYGPGFAPWPGQPGPSMNWLRLPAFPTLSSTLPSLPRVGNWSRGPSLRGLGAFGEFLYLRPRDSEVAFAVPGQAPVVVGGNPNRPVPQGRTLVLDPEYSSGFRAGVTAPLGDCTTLQVAYAHWEGDDQTGRTLTAAEIAQNVSLFPLLIHPLTALPNNATNVGAQGTLDMEFNTLDVDVRQLLWDSHVVKVTGYLGARGAELEQTLFTSYTINNGTVVQAATEYEGIGGRLGLDGSGRLGCCGFGVYGRSELSLLYGTARAHFAQFQVNNATNPQAFTDWEADRLAPIYEMELGVQWMGPRERLRLSVGYLMSVWFNVVTVEDYMQGVQQNQFDDFSDTITFDGLTARVEFRL